MHILYASSGVDFVYWLKPTAHLLSCRVHSLQTSPYDIMCTTCLLAFSHLYVLYINF